MKELKVLIADDERPAREYLKSLLHAFEGIEIVAEAADGAEALRLIKSLKPDLALLDLQMPELSGLEVARSVGQDEMPMVAFVTAFDEYAINAFELNAVDYLLKPVEKDRLAETLRRVRARADKDDRQAVESERIASASHSYEMSAKPELIERIPVRKQDQIFLIPVGEIASITADGELLHITTLENQRFVINFRLKDLEARLDPGKFVRVSRAAIINLDHTAHISPNAGGTYTVFLQNGQEVAVSRQHSRLLRSRVLKL